MAVRMAFRPSERRMMTLATLGPVGFLRPAPGSWGSAAALVMGAGLAFLSPRLLEVAALVVCILGTMAAGIYQRETGRHDAGEVVIDEVAGQWIALLVVPLDWRWYLAAFLLFRVFDILKPGPVRMAEKLPGGVGVMADDIVAGVFAAVCLLIIQWGIGSQWGLAG
jgi:phosphatidylglycerophosphatase A